MKVLKAKGRLVRQEQEKHQYPFCWRSGCLPGWLIFLTLLTAVLHRSNTPIIYRAFRVWNVKVTPIIDDLVKNNAETRWFVAVKFPDPAIVLNFSSCFQGAAKCW